MCTIFGQFNKNKFFDKFFVQNEAAKNKDKFIMLYEKSKKGTLKHI